MHTNGKQLPAFKLDIRPGSEPRSQRLVGKNVSILPLWALLSNSRFCIQLIYVERERPLTFSYFGLLFIFESQVRKQCFGCNIDFFKKKGKMFIILLHSAGKKYSVNYKNVSRCNIPQG